MPLQMNFSMLTENARQKLDFVNCGIGTTIDELYRPEAIILFGSYAHGQPDEWSDVDLLIISDAFREVPKLRRRSQFLINTGAYLHKGLDIEPLCLTPDEFLHGIQWATIEREAVETGIVVLDRTGTVGRAKEKITPKQRLSVATTVRTLEEQRQRLGPVDQLEVQLVGQADSLQRYSMMYSLRGIIVNTWAGWLNAKYPEMSNIERSRLLFERLQESG